MIAIQKRVYLAKSLRTAAEDPNTQVVYNTIHEVVRRLDWLDANSDPMRTIYLNHYERDLAKIQCAHAMIAEVSISSSALGYKICYAREVRHIPALCVAYKDTDVASILQDGAGVAFYRDRQDLASQVEDFLEGLKS